MQACHTQVSSLRGRVLLPSLWHPACCVDDRPLHAPAPALGCRRGCCRLRRRPPAAQQLCAQTTTQPPSVAVVDVLPSKLVTSKQANSSASNGGGKQLQKYDARLAAEQTRMNDAGQRA
jgi:hypothetical protein